MNYKISTYLLLVALVATIVYFRTRTTQAEPLYFKTFSNTTKDATSDSILITKESLDILEDELNQYTEMLHYDNPEVIEEWTNAEVDPMAGTPYTPEEAGLRMRMFTDWNNRSWNFVRPILPYGFAFGKDRLRLMLEEIERINGPLSEDKKIVGVRIHLSVAKPEQNAERGNMDVMLIPVTKDGKSYFKFNDVTATTFRVPSNALVNTSSPCPTMCN